MGRYEDMREKMEKKQEKQREERDPKRYERRGQFFRACQDNICRDGTEPARG